MKLADYRADFYIFSGKASDLCRQLADSFLADLEDSKLLTLAAWRRRSKREILGDRVARLFSPLL